MFAWIRRLFAAGPPRSPPAPPSSPETAVLYRVEYQIASTPAEVHRVLASGRRAMYRFQCIAYYPVMRELSQFIESAFGKESPEQKAVLSSPMVCPKCNVLFSDSWGVKAALFGGEGAPCPRCGNDEALLVLVVYRPEDITEQDVAALRAYWESNGQARETIDGKLNDALDKLMANPHYFGATELWRARNYVAQQAAEGVKWTDDDLIGAFRDLKAQAMLELVAMESAGGRKLGEEDFFNAIMSRVHTGLNKGLPRPLSNDGGLETGTQLVLAS